MNLTVINSGTGTISGGLGNGGLGSRADAITFAGGTNFITFDHAGTTGLIGNITVTGSLNFNQNVGVNTTVANVITGPGSVSKSGADTITFSGVNSYTGGSTINAGTLALSGAGTLGAITNAITVNGATAALDLGGTTQTQNGGATLAGGGTIRNGTLSSTGTFAMQSGTVSAVLAGGGGVSKTTSGTVTFSGANTYTGGTSINAGILQLGNGGTTGSIVGDVVNNATLAFNRSNTYQFDGAISGSGGVQQNGSGTTILTAANTYGGGTSINAGILQLGNGGATGSIVGNVVNNATLAFNRSNTYEFDGAISGSGGVQQNGSGTTILTAANTYGGGTSINAGILQLGNGGTTGSIVGNVVNNATLAFNRSNTYQFDGAISGSGGVQQNGSGTTILTAANTYGGGTSINAGILQLGNGGTTGSIVGNVVNNATLAFNRSKHLSVRRHDLRHRRCAAEWQRHDHSDGEQHLQRCDHGQRRHALRERLDRQFDHGQCRRHARRQRHGRQHHHQRRHARARQFDRHADHPGQPGADLGRGLPRRGLADAGRPHQCHRQRDARRHRAGGVRAGQLCRAHLYHPVGNGRAHAARSAASRPAGLPAGFVGSLSYTGTDAILNLTAAGHRAHLDSSRCRRRPEPSTSATSPTRSTTSSTTAARCRRVSCSVFGLTGSNLTNALTLLSGEAATGAQQGAFQLTDQFLDLMLDPFVDGRSGVGGAGGPALGFAPERAGAAGGHRARLCQGDEDAGVQGGAGAFEPRWTAWGAGYGGYNKTSGDPAVVGSHDLIARTFGFAAGLDYHFTRDTVAGFALAGGGTNWTLAQGLGSGRSDAFQAGVYAATRSGPAYLAASLRVRQSLDVDRPLRRLRRSSHRRLQGAELWRPRRDRLSLRRPGRRE